MCYGNTYIFKSHYLKETSTFGYCCSKSAGVIGLNRGKIFISAYLDKINVDLFKSVLKDIHLPFNDKYFCNFIEDNTKHL